MSNYVWGSHLSHADYLQAKSFVSDMKSATREAGRKVSMDISCQTRDIIASNESLHREHIEMLNASTDRTVGALNDGFERLSYSMDAGFDQISSGISELNATFHWGFGAILASIGHMNDTLSELVKIAKTPVQTVAFNHFEIARDAFRQGLYRESLEELDKAISGDHTSAGYKLEWRFHQMKGTLQLGFADCDMSLYDLPKAEESFLAAARYGKTDYPHDAGRAFLSAGWAAYCQGKMKEALAHTEQAMTLHPDMGEVLFQASKVQMALGDVESALPLLAKAIDIDRFYALKAAGDGDFQLHDAQLRSFLEALRKEKYRQCVPKVKEALAHTEQAMALHPEMGEVFFQASKVQMALGDVESALPMLARAIDIDRFYALKAAGDGDFQPHDAKLRNFLEALRKEKYKQCVPKVKAALDRIKGFELAPGTENRLQVFLDEGADWPIMDMLEVVQNLDSFKHLPIIVRIKAPGNPVNTKETYTEEETYYEDVVITPGGFFKKAVTEKQKKTRMVTKTRTVAASSSGNEITLFEFCPIHAGTFKMESNEVRIDQDFYLGKYQVTQQQWEAVMGNNPSNFKGGSLPVETVSWDDAQIFIQKLNQLSGKKNYRLPTEGEWEYACRAGSTSDYYFGDNESQLGEYAWYDGNSGATTHPVGQKKPNEWGLYDMAGNVWEWTDSWYDSSHSSRVIRGGSWYYFAGRCRSDCRRRGAPGGRVNFIGFRLVFVP